MKKLFILFGIVIITLFAMTILWQIGKSRTFQFFGEIVPRVETDQKVVALTFDDGPTPKFTDEILQILKEEDIKGTFFVIGGELEKNPDEGKKIAAAGHELGNHSYSHVRMIMITPDFAREEIEKTDALIRATGYEKPTHFRPPYGKKLFALPYYLSQTGRKSITWDVEPESYEPVGRSSEEITKHVLENTKEGSIVLLHIAYDPERKSMNAVRPIIKGLREKGFRFVTISELLAMAK